MSFSQGIAALVVDASVAVAFLRGESDWRQKWDSWAGSGTILLAPPHFNPEVANALLRSVRMPREDTIVEIGRLARSGVEAADRGLRGLQEAIELADKHRLTVYDALYLQLAKEVEGELATLDKDLGAAAKAEGVIVVR